MAAVFLAIAGSAGASAASGSISEAQKRKTQLENDLNDAQALIEQLQDQEGDIQEAVRELDDRLNVISGNIDTLKAQTRQKNKELLDTQNQLEAARTDESEQYESMKVRIRYMYQNSGIGYLEALLESGSFAKMLKQVDYMSTMMQYDRAKLEEYQQTQVLIQNAEETIRKDKADLEALQAQLEEEQQAVNLLMQEKETQLSGVRQGISEAEQNAQQYQQEIEAENQLIQEMLAAEAAAKKAAEKAKEAAEFVARHWKGVLVVLAGFLLIVMLIGGLQSCSALVGAAGGGVAASSYQSEDADILAAEAAYCALEAELQEYLDTYERTHDYDEYHYDLDEIKHDPYVLASILSALHDGAWTASEVRGTLQMLFEKQYILTETVVTEVRYRTVTRTDSEGNEYEVEVPYNYYICTVELENFDLSHLPVYIMDEETLSKYALYMSVLGNKPELFGDSEYIPKYITNRPEGYEIPPSAMEDETFAAVITEAEKYLGYPYVWGGSSPSTSFDCSGFVSWVLTNSGVCNTGRLGAQGLYNISTPVSNPQPGDLVFFVGTYDTPGVSHVGIYVGNSMMIHCGDPISYSNLNSSYWQAHFYAYARPPYS